MLPTTIEDVSTRSARAKLVNGVLHVKLPRHWPAAYRDQTILKFQRWAVKQARMAESLPASGEGDGQLWTLQAFDAHVRAINAETLNLPVKAVRIGAARHSRLAQCNTRTGVLTFSSFAIDGMPLRALRYLILHEIAHLREANHSARFWALVEQHEPDYKRQRAIAQAHHGRAVDEEGAPKERGAAEQTPMPRAVLAPEAPLLPDPEAHPFGPLFSFLPSK